MFEYYGIQRFELLDPVIEANLLLALTGFTSLLDVIDSDAVSAAIDYYLDRLFDGTSHRPAGEDGTCSPPRARR